MLGAMKIAVAGAMLMGAGMATAGPDDVATKSYMLTMPKIQRYQQVMVALEHSTNPAVKAEMPRIDGLLNGSIAQALAKVRSAPHIEGVIRQAGSTDTDFVMVPTVLIGASMAAAAPSAAANMPVSSANVAFVKQHQAELKAMKLFGND